ncbi:hypothetical protein B0H11DRAFT_2285526 [Mycena galericulata]|nr:hypothetical protein B0H11DRAFT_2285526 [Mycena galericulata]
MSGFQTNSTEGSLAQVLSLVQQAVLKAVWIYYPAFPVFTCRQESDLDAEVKLETARLRSEAHQARAERDKICKALYAVEITAAGYETERSQMHEKIQNLRREVTHWQGVANSWHAKVEQGRCGRSNLLEPPKAQESTLQPSPARSLSEIPPSSNDRQQGESAQVEPIIIKQEETEDPRWEDSQEVPKTKTAENLAPTVGKVIVVRRKTITRKAKTLRTSTIVGTPATRRSTRSAAAR